jgi:hypothetical protein
MKKSRILPHLNPMIHYDSGAARDDLVDDRIKDRFEFPIGKSNPAFADP